MTDTTLPKALTEIGDSAFKECKSLNKVVVPNKVVKIGNYAFSGCSEYDEELRQKGYAYLYEDMGLRSIDLTQASSLASIGEWAFEYTAITSCDLPINVTTVSSGLFSGCMFLDRVQCSEETTAIRGSVFSNCTNLGSLNVPAKATISYNAFAGKTRGMFTLAVTDPEPISVSIGEIEELPINTFLGENYARAQISISEKNGETGCLEIVESGIEEINEWKITKIKVKGKHILLIDDIYTTGSTIDAISKVFLEEVHNKVWFLTISIGQDF